MYGIDYQVRDICVEHRRSLLTLLKLQFHSFEPCYVKVPPNAVRPPSQGKMIPSSSGSSPFGVFSLLSKDKADLETLFFAPTEGTPPLHPDLQMEIYHDREELDLICAGKVSQIILQEIKPDVDDAILRQDSLMQSTSYFQLFAMAVLTLPLRHKCQGKFSIDAGTVEISIKLYRIDVNKVHRQTFVSAFPTTNHVDPAAHHCNSSTCKVCNPYQSNMFGVSVEVPHLRKVSMPVPPHRTTASDDEPDYESNIEELNTTKEDDYDSVDEFIESFKSKHMLPLEEEEEDMKQVLRQSVQLRSSVASSISLSHIERQIALQQRQVSFHSNVKSSTSTPGNTQRKAGSGKSTSNTLKKKKKAPTPSYLAPYAMSLGSGRR